LPLALLLQKMLFPIQLLQEIRLENEEKDSQKVK
jgi:hypothetical protein